MKPTTSEYIDVKNSKIHNKGVFAAKDIPKGAKIIEYVGEKITKKESEKRCDLALEKAKKNPKLGSVYIFELNKRYDIDGDVPYNTAKYINHSCEPNCEAEIEDNHIWIKALRKIPKGEELGYNYGYSVDDYENHPCRCGSKRCVGYIVEEDEWPKLKKELEKKKKQKK